jgi:hypothetical protein
MTWAEEEFKTADLGDKRLNKRLILLAERLAESPMASIPEACSGWAEVQGAYRFLAQEDIGWEDVMTSHFGCTTQRMATHSVVLCIQDTTELDFNGQQIEGLGPLSYETQRGMFLHPTYAVSIDREPLGILDAWMWARSTKDENGIRPGIKESLRWIEGYTQLAELAEKLPDTRLVYVADREADIVELMRRAHELGTPVDWLIRSQHNRALPSGDKLWQLVKAGDPVGEIEFTLPAQKGKKGQTAQKARTVRQEVRILLVKLSNGRGGQLDAYCVIASEVDAPPGVQPIEWRLLTNRKVEEFESAAELIDWYRARWEIEIFFHVLKTGCRVETLQLSTIDRVERALAIFMVVAWRIAHLMRLGRTCPDLDAELLFDREEWQAAYILMKRPFPKQTPRLNEVVRLVAMVGGFLGRKGDGEPGVKTLWQGLQRVMDCAHGIRWTRENCAV